MKQNSFKLTLLLAILIGLNACQPKLDTSNKETQKASSEAILAKLDSVNQKRFLGAVFKISMSPELNEHGIFSLSENIDKAADDSITEKLHGMTYQDVMAWAEEIDIEIERGKLKHAYTKKAKEAEYKKLYDKVSFTPEKLEKDDYFKDWVNIYFTYENNLPNNITAFNYKAIFQLPDTLIVLNSIMNLAIEKNSKGTDKFFISNKIFEEVENPDIANFTFELTGITNNSLPDDERTIFDKNLFTEEDEALIAELSAKYPDIK